MGYVPQFDIADPVRAHQDFDGFYKRIVGIYQVFKKSDFSASPGVKRATIINMAYLMNEIWANADQRLSLGLMYQRSLWALAFMWITTLIDHYEMDLPDLPLMQDVKQCLLRSVLSPSGRLVFSQFLCWKKFEYYSQLFEKNYYRREAESSARKVFAGRLYHKNPSFRILPPNEKDCVLSLMPLIVLRARNAPEEGALQPAGSSVSLVDFPDEVLIHILTFLSKEALASVSQVSTKFGRLVEDRTLLGPLQSVPRPRHFPDLGAPENLATIPDIQTIIRQMRTYLQPRSFPLLDAIRDAVLAGRVSLLCLYDMLAYLHETRRGEGQPANAITMPGLFHFLPPIFYRR